MSRRLMYLISCAVENTYACPDSCSVKGCAYCGGLGHRISDCPKLETTRQKTTSATKARSCAAATNSAQRMDCLELEDYLTTGAARYTGAEGRLGTYGLAWNTQAAGCTSWCQHHKGSGVFMFRVHANCKATPATGELRVTPVWNTRVLWFYLAELSRSLLQQPSMCNKSHSISTAECICVGQKVIAACSVGWYC